MISRLFVFAAGRGARLAPLTDRVPKPLVMVAGKPLIDYHLERAQRANIQDVVINVSYKGQQIIDHVGDGARFGLNVIYSIEPKPLETAGGLVFARQHLGDGDFFLLNADIYTHIELAQFKKPVGQSLHLLMVPNPEEQPHGNFALDKNGMLHDIAAIEASNYTYSGMGVYSTEFVDSIDMLGYGEPEYQRLPFYMRRWMREQRVSGQLIDDFWCDVGTMQRLQQLDTFLKQ